MIRLVMFPGFFSPIPCSYPLLFGLDSHYQGWVVREPGAVTAAEASQERVSLRWAAEPHQSPDGGYLSRPMSHPVSQHNVLLRGISFHGPILVSSARKVPNQQNDLNVAWHLI